MMTRDDDMAEPGSKSEYESAVHRDARPQRADVTFSFSNIGPVKNVDLELGELTIIAGRNNTGKSYLVYTLYGFLKMWDGWPAVQLFGSGTSKSGIDIPNIPEIVELLVREGKATLDAAPDSLERQRKKILTRLSRDFSKDAISQVFSSQSGDFDDASISIKTIGSRNIELDFLPFTYRLSDAGSLKWRLDGTEIVITLDAPNRRRLPPNLDILVAAGYLEVLLGSLFPEPFILSAERFGISLFYRELDFTKNQLVDLLQKMGSEKNRERYSPFLFIDRATSRYALPIKDNIDYTRSLPDRKKDKSEFYSDKLFNNIKDMMDGYFKTSGDEIRFVSKARVPERSFNVPLHLASSSARGLSDLYFFLRHVAKRNHLLIIDEPESHLDTANQIRLARLLARIVRTGLRVLITTHSDYLIKEFNNLIMLGSDFEDKAAVLKSLKY